MADFYNRQGEPCGMEEWTAAFKDNIVKKTDVGDYEVSTIFTGTGPQEIFETVVFFNGESKTCECCGQIIWRDNPEWRYAAELAAREHHGAIVAALQANGDDSNLPGPLEHLKKGNDLE